MNAFDGDTVYDQFVKGKHLDEARRDWTAKYGDKPMFSREWWGKIGAVYGVPEEPVEIAPKEWTLAEMFSVEEMWNRGMLPGEIGAVLERSHMSVRRKIDKMRAAGWELAARQDRSRAPREPGLIDRLREQMASG